ncbi:condensation domain-containing protein [Actinophytocola algeriensis]|uniref:Condensation domain-containing protein n=1 Tax=Actinophytocola algeriensis TaxID=1768010 RepID=A0A7W7VHP8_9PSEU|nr:condensation domain-containing protein [Actinophytocola algeriensis]MBB4910648.1 hypothetical protein [Actinophytocola algeriensis]MBE1473641.1 hypothetical protein [Actinophytocola algeriensis]
MVEALDRAGDFPCTWDQNETLSSAHHGIKKPDPVVKSWFVGERATVTALRDAWWAVVARHPALRVCYRQDQPGYWTQRILPVEAVEAWFTVLDDPDDGEVARLRARVGPHTGQLFAVIVACGRTGRTLHLALDHICADGWSLAVIIDELSDLLAGRHVDTDVVDMEFFRHCLDNAPSAEEKDRLAESWAAAPPGTFPPYQVPPLRLPDTTGGYAVESSRAVLPWTSFAFDGRAAAAGVGPALLTRWLAEVHGAEPGEFPMVVGVSGRRSREQQRSVGMYFAWHMLSVPVDDSSLATRARRTHGRLLTLLRRPPPPFALDSAIRVPELAGARNWPYEMSPRFLYANHLTPMPPLLVGGAPAEIVPAGDDVVRGFGLARVVSRSRPDGLELEFVARSDLLGTGVTDRLARHAAGTVSSGMAP